MPSPDFDLGVPTTRPLSVRAAVDRGHSVINRRVFQIMTALFSIGLGVAIVFGREYDGLVIVLSAPVAAWVWWSYAIPRWRAWAHTRGADPVELQRVAEEEMLVWPVGHFFQYTEFRIWRD